MKPLEGTATKKSLITVSPARSGAEKTIVVLGVERGGTSMVAGMIRALGIDLGERAGRNHEDPKFLSDDQDKLLAQIKAYNASKPVWGFKVPKATLMLDFYDKHLRNPHYILVFRNVEATVDSWCSRGANDPMDSALHAMEYYNAALGFFKDKKKPLVFASYERACDAPESFAAELAAFLDTEQDDATIKRAASIVTGEGGGYVDLPEYYFHMDALSCTSWPKIRLDFKIDGASEKHCMVSKKKVGDRVVLLPEGDFFPKDFYVGFNLVDASASLLAEQGLRVYMDFTGEFFPGHAFRPPLRQGKNLLKISTHGNVKRIALGALQPNYTFGFEDVGCYEATFEGEADGYQVINAGSTHATSWMWKVFRKLRLLLERVRGDSNKGGSEK